jgi:hypothetical protein
MPWTTTSAIIGSIMVSGSFALDSLIDKKMADTAKTKAALPTSQCAQLKIHLFMQKQNV